MQIIMECLVGWDFTAKKQGQPGIFGKVLGWSDTTEEQSKFTLYSHVLLFISEFDTLVSLLWSKNEKVRDEAKKELERYMKKPCHQPTTCQRKTTSMKSRKVL
jgi:hypothetical protein